MMKSLSVWAVLWWSWWAVTVLLVPEETSQQAPSVPLAVETETTPADDPAPASDPAPDAETVLEDMAADARENLPEDLTDTVTLTDALFLPRMRIMEYSYVTSPPMPAPLPARCGP